MNEFELMSKLNGHLATLSEKDRGALLYVLCDADNPASLGEAIRDCNEGGLSAISHAERSRVANWAAKAHKRVRPFSAAAARSGNGNGHSPEPAGAGKKN